MTNPVTDNELRRRAVAAYYRTAQTNGDLDTPSGGGDVAEFDGKMYVVLSNIRGTLAVYRVQNNGMLRRMKRWPREVAPR
jgi:hypothetical protein